MPVARLLPALLAGLTFAQPAGPLPVTVTDSTNARVIVASAERIVPVNGDLAEVLYALGPGDAIVARGLSATYPPEVASVPVIGYQRSLAPEPVAAARPTVVLTNTLAGPPGAIGQIRALAHTLVLEYLDTVEGPPEKIRAVARAFGGPERGDELARSVEREIAAARDLAARVLVDAAPTPHLPGPRTACWPSTGVTASSNCQRSPL